MFLDRQHAFDWLKCIVRLFVWGSDHAYLHTQTTMSDVPPLIPLDSTPFGHDVPGALQSVGDVLPVGQLEFFDKHRTTSEHATAPLSAVRNFRVPVNVIWPEFG